MKFDKVVTSLNLKKNKVVQCIHLKISRNKYIFLILYVDNFLLAYNDIGLLHETKKLLSKTFDMKDLEDASFVLRIEIHKDKSHNLLGLS